MSLKIKDLDLGTNVIQSPLAGCTDLAFRLTARKYGMKFAFLEMVSAEALVRGNQRTRDLLKSTEEDKPLGAQLVGCNPDVIGEAAAIVEEEGFQLLDLNFGCPVPKIVSPGGGSKLLAEPEKARKIFKSVIKNVKKMPVTVKMRKGFNDPSGDEAVTISRIAEEEGFSAVTVHGRTRVQGYSGHADWESIGKVKKAVKIPVIGNGDVTSGADAKKLMEISGCDAVMIGRGSLGNPWIFESIEKSLRGEEGDHPPAFKELKEALLHHLRLEMETEGEKIGVLKARRIACWYFKNRPFVAEFRNAINHTHTAEELFKIIDDFEKKQEDDEYFSPVIPA